MRYLSMLFGVLLVFALSVPALAAQKIVVFSLPELVSRSDKTEAETKRLEAMFGRDRANLQQMEAALRQRADELRIQASALSLEAQQDRQMELVRLQRDYEDAMHSLARRAEIEENRIRMEIIELVQNAAEAYAKKNNIDIIIESSMSVIYTTDAADITRQLLEEMNALWRAAGGGR
jgi:outer membrane protein